MPGASFGAGRRRVLALGLTPLLGVSGGVAEAGTPGEVLVGQLLRDATLRGLNGPARQLSSYRGRPLIINVWASWCAPCRAEMASLERLAWGDLAQRFAIIGISTDDHVERAQSWLRRSNATISHFIDRRLELEHMLGATHLPLTVLADASGRVLAKVSGAREWDDAGSRRLVEGHFRRPGAAPSSGSAPRTAVR
ncbi:MAG: TlpA family protein disulfide reductase [Leptothrix sp. (in: Bacteria)]|nr:TlpA family protein disulfide reductase [Leptothrix sp. (in: b-proteobacteria)]